MQRGCRAWSRRRNECAAASHEVRRAQVPEQCGRRRGDESNARSEPAAASEAEARAFQRNRAVENGTLAVRCILGSEILETPGPTTVEQEETLHTSRGQSFIVNPGTREQ
jgi:hypothetical protein